MPSLVVLVVAAMAVGLWPHLAVEGRGIPAAGSELLHKVQRMRQDVVAHSGIASQIINLAVHGAAQNRSYERLALFTDKIGNRISGSKALEQAIAYMLSALRDDGLENVHPEAAKVPHWVRGRESATMIEPRNHSLAILGLGGSVGTPPEGTTADVLVVSSFDELRKLGAAAKGKIVVYNEPYVSYGETVKYRGVGASEAAKFGAVAVLIRSVTPFSIHSPHTGIQEYEAGVAQIPAACVAVEDAEMMARMAARGWRVRVTLAMEARSLPDADSYNTVAEIVGSKYPEQVVLLSGHLDSWDVGQGAMDDGGGAFISWEALSLIRDLGLRPKRTMRLVLWTGEEQGGIGAARYFQDHKANISNFDLVMESDIGTFRPLGLRFSGSEAARAVVADVAKMLEPLNATALLPGAEGTDIDFWMQAGVPGASLYDDAGRYFWFHHSDGDSMSVQDPGDMNRCAALWAIVSYVVADLEEMLPR
ncbi:carboxypeptidase Q isoform X1 [Petromyzon marinus]|uniref:carboxypeptidase Q isoform X1 n=1 Tax=Petromyzon marinus TaxID=7757 RepID=UPI003F71732D